MLLTTPSFGNYFVNVTQAPQIVFTHSSFPENFDPSESICVKRTLDSLACGQVIKKKETSLIIKITKIEPLVTANQVNDEGLGIPVGENIKEQSLLEIRFEDLNQGPMRAESETSKSPQTTDTVIQAPSGTAQLTQPKAFLGVGLDYIFPQVKYQYLLFPQTALGLTAILMNHSNLEGVQLVGAGGIVLLSYYPDKIFEGLWVEVGAGGYFLGPLTGSTYQHSFAPSVMGHLGWRWKWNDGLGLGFAAGAQLLLVSRSVSSLLPSLSFDISFAM